MKTDWFQETTLMLASITNLRLTNATTTLIAQKSYQFVQPSCSGLMLAWSQKQAYTSNIQYDVHRSRSGFRCWLLPACELHGQYEQDAEHDSPAQKTRSPGHQKQHLPERLPHPAQHYRLSSALRPIYTPWLLLNASICLPGGGKLVRQGTELTWIGHRCCWCVGYSNTVRPTFLPHVDFSLPQQWRKGETVKYCRRFKTVHLIMFNNVKVELIVTQADVKTKETGLSTQYILICP